MPFSYGSYGNYGSADQSGGYQSAPPQVCLILLYSETENDIEEKKIVK